MYVRSSPDRPRLTSAAVLREPLSDRRCPGPSWANFCTAPPCRPAAVSCDAFGPCQPLLGRYSRTEALQHAPGRGRSERKNPPPVLLIGSRGCWRDQFREWKPVVMGDDAGSRVRDVV